MGCRLRAKEALAARRCVSGEGNLRLCPVLLEGGEFTVGGCLHTTWTTVKPAVESSTVNVNGRSCTGKSDFGCGRDTLLATRALYTWYRMQERAAQSSRHLGLEPGLRIIPIRLATVNTKSNTPFSI